jgi:prophage tail gpP-like protein
MPFETVEFSVAGRPLAIKSAELKASAEEAVRQASFDITHTGAGVPCQPDDPATVTVQGELWGTGYVRDVRCEHDAVNRSYRVTFVSRTCDATECSIDHPSGLKLDSDLTGIAEEFDMMGIGIESDVSTETKPVHKIVVGETLFETIEQDARAQGVLVYDTPDGKLKLADKPEGRHAGALRRGENIERASGNLTGAGKHSPVKVRGQNSDGVKAPALRGEATARAALSRARPRILVQEGEATTGRLKNRAAWEARRGAGNGTNCTITAPGWRDRAGRLWERNRLVEVDDDWLGIKQDMIIASVTLRQDDAGGTVAAIECKDPRALGGKNPRGKSASAWAAPGDNEPESNVTGVVGIDY